MKAKSRLPNPFDIAPPRKRPLRLVVIGNGMVGFKFLERLTEQDFERRFQITVFGAEPRPAYDRIHLTDLLSGKTGNQLQFGDKNWYQERQISLRTGDPVIAIDPKDCSVTTQQGIKASYNRLVLATGSRPHVPPIPGHDAKGVFVYRTIEDLEGIQIQAAKSKRAAVIGGGLLGLEAAGALKRMGLETHIIERNIGLMSQQLPQEGTMVLQQEILRQGFQLHLNRHTKAIRQIGDELLVEFQNGQAQLVDLVIFASGIRPRDELGAHIGLKIHSRGGIQIDDELRTTAPQIYALGECANHRGIVYGLVAPGYKMADILAARFLGHDATFQGDHLAARLKLLGVDVATFGDHQGEGNYLQKQDRKTFRRLVFRNQRLVGATIVGPCEEINRIQSAIDQGLRLRRWNLARFKRTGNLWAATSPANVSEWPPSSLICTCKNVRRAELSEAIAKYGCDSIESLAHHTGASTTCGSCRPLLANLIGAPESTLAMNGSRGLLLTSILTAVFSMAITVIPPSTSASSVNEVKWQFLWTESFWKFTTGYTLTALCLVSLVLSLRKRIKRIQFGNYGLWRFGHSLVGVGTLLVLITHTGFRMGENLNFILMLNFLGLAFFGGFAGLITVMESKVSHPWARRIRSMGTLAHTLLFWPLPVLIFFHAFKAY